VTDFFPVLLGICLDGSANWTGKDPANARRPTVLSQGTFEFEDGLPAVLDLLDRHAAKATFYVPGITAEARPDAIRQIAGRGHELASHGYDHRALSGLSETEEEAEIVGGIAALETILGYRPVGFRAGSWDFSHRTIPLLLKHGVKVSANFHARLRPYRHRLEGAPVDLVEMPVQWHLADYAYFSPGVGGSRPMTSAAAAEAVWVEEFEGLYATPGAFYHLTLHVQLIGHPGRLAMLDRHLGFITSHPRARVVTAGALARTIP